jgi:hypothetical protein
VSDADVKFVIAAVNDASKTISQVQQQLATLKGAYGGVSGAAAGVNSAGNAAAAAVAKTGQASQAASQAARALTQELQGQAQAMAANMGVLGGMAARLAAVNPVVGGLALAVTGAAGAFLLASKSIGTYDESIRITAEQTGLTAQELGGVNVAAINVGRSFDQAQMAMFMFNRNIAEAGQGASDKLRVFDRLGVSVRDATGNLRGTGDVLRDVAHALDLIPSASERNTAAMALFGRGARAILPIIRQDIEALIPVAEQFGITLSESQSASAQRADQAWDEFSGRMKGMAVTVTAAMAPIGTEMVETVNRALSGFKQIWDDAAKIKPITFSVAGIPAKIEIPVIFKFIAAETKKGVDEVARDFANRLKEGIKASFAATPPGERAAAGFTGNLGGLMGGSPAAAEHAANQAVEADAARIKALHQADDAERLAAIVAYNKGVHEQIAQINDLASVQKTALSVQVDALGKLMLQTRTVEAQRDVWREIIRLMETPRWRAETEAPGPTLPGAPKFTTYQESSKSFAYKVPSTSAPAMAEEKARKEISDYQNMIAGSFGNMWGNLVSATMRGAANIEDIWRNFLVNLASDLVAMTAEKAVLSLFGIKVFSGGGTALALAGGGTIGTPFTGGIPRLAGGAGLSRFARGTDVIHGMLTAGETVITKRDTNRLSDFLDRALSPAAQAGAGREVNVSFGDIKFAGPSLSKRDMKAFVRNDVMPEVVEGLRQAGVPVGR